MHGPHLHDIRLKNIQLNHMIWFLFGDARKGLHKKGGVQCQAMLPEICNSAHHCGINGIKLFSTCCYWKINYFGLIKRLSVTLGRIHEFSKTL